LRELAAEKRKDVQKLVHITGFLKNELFRLQIYIMLNTVSLCEYFHFVRYCIFFHNLIIYFIELKLR
jgi:hypothetical protein